MYKAVFTSVEGPLEDIFGKEWFILHWSHTVGVIRNVNFVLKERSLLQFKHKILPSNALQIEEGSLTVHSVTDCVVSFHFSSFCRRNPLLKIREEDEDFWRSRVRELLNAE